MTNQTEIAKAIQNDLPVVRMEVENQQLTAAKSPRDESKVLATALQELRLAPEFAKKAFYSIPYKDGKGGIVHIEGPSVKAAMALARRWRNSANGARIVSEDDSRVQVEGIFIDYETNTRTVRPISVSRLRFDKDTKTMVPLREDKLNIAIQAGMSKAVRNAILASLPAYLIEKYVNEAKALTVQGEAPKIQPKMIRMNLERLIHEFVARGIAKEIISDYLKQLLETGNETEAVATLTGILNAVEDGQVSLEEVFGKTKPEIKQQSGQIPAVNELFNEPKK